MAPLTKGQQDKHGLGLEVGRRRSMRVLLSIPIQVSGKCPDGEEFKEDTRTLVVNAHGALIALAAGVAAGQQVHLTNRSTRDARECRIVYLGNASGGKIQMGIEFTEPSATFWHVDFPPDDWVVPKTNTLSPRQKILHKLLVTLRRPARRVCFRRAVPLAASPEFSPRRSPATP